MTGAPRIVRDNRTLFTHYDELEAGDIVCCRLRLKPGEEHLLLDLSERGIVCFPSPTAQLCSRSKAFQTRLFGWAMIPGTTVVYTVHDLIGAIAEFAQAGVTRVVVKIEGKNGGLGVFLYRSVEDVYSQSALGTIPHPYVLQPYLPDCRDLRVIVLDDYWEVYERSNPHNFRHNLRCGGSPQPAVLTAEQHRLCERIMKRGDFPYAHVDLMVTEDGMTYFTEINLRGGLRGAAIDPDTYRRKVAAITDSWCRARGGGTEVGAGAERRIKKREAPSPEPPLSSTER